jgi:pimeloyl-ACP methyl ester carboxylesterase
MRIFRHFVRVGNRRVHYRRAGQGPSLIMVHQSPRSSAEYEPLMRKWGRFFTCIAPDSPGFGQSDELPGSPDIGDFAQAYLDLLDALGIERTAAYGFHSGGIILVSAARRSPERFTALAIGGYAIWTPQEMALFSEGYLPPFQPSAYGEHLTWLWNRILEQTWFFPWFDVRNGTRLRVAHDDPVRTDAVVRDMLDSGDAYRAGYGAVLRSPRDIPPATAKTPPVFIGAYEGDPLHAHIARLGTLPPNWSARGVATPADLEAACLEHVRQTPPTPCPAPPEGKDAGFVAVTVPGFDGLVHWSGQRDAETIVLHAPGRSAELLDTSRVLAIDLPGHGLSDDWQNGHVAGLKDWSAVAVAAIKAIGATGQRVIIGEGLSAFLAATVAREVAASGWGAIDAHIPQPQDSKRWAELAIPDLTPDRFGNYLNAAWSAVRAAHFFWPWFDGKAPNAVPFESGDIAPAALALEHRSLIQARAGRALLQTLLNVDREQLLAGAPAITKWERAPWAKERADIWSPKV